MLQNSSYSRRYLQSKFENTIQKLPKTAQTPVYAHLFSKSAQNQLNRRNFKNSPKFEIVFFSGFVFSVGKQGTKARSHRPDFQSNNFLHAFFIIKKGPLYLNFSIPPCKKSSISPGSISSLRVRIT